MFGQARLIFGVKLIDVGHRACLRFLLGYFWPLVAIEGLCAISWISLHESEVQDSGEIERRPSPTNVAAIARESAQGSRRDGEWNFSVPSEVAPIDK
jgi:hypothetical protein